MLYLSVGFVFILFSLYAMYKMVGCVQRELDSMRDGLHDVIPLDLLSGLAAEVSSVLHRLLTHIHHICTLIGLSIVTLWRIC